VNAIVFCGPSLTPADLAAYEFMEFRPPVRQGELYAAAVANPGVIGIVDGYFDGQPAVLHKEILWAMSRGIAVFGASSMGALRAAELHRFGMRGVGRIFEAYRDGELADDDEVALVHGPPETGYIRLSEPMVNIRATLEQAVAQGIIDRDTGSSLAIAAKARFYQLRNWPDLLDTLGDREQAKTLSVWLRTGKVDRKRDDGLELLRQVDAWIRSGARPDPPNFHFEWTENWHDAPWRRQAQAGSDPGGAEEEAMLDELRLRGDYARLRRDALLRMLARGEADGTPDRRAVRRATDTFRSSRGLMRQSDLADWARDNGTDVAGLERMLTDNARVETLAREYDAELHRDILDRMRELDLYASCRESALARRRASLSVPRSPSMPRALLAAWYFEKRLGLAVPEDLVDYAASIGLSSIDKFYELVALEYYFHNRAHLANDSGASDENSIA
jgi:hypothetical protein